MGPQANDILESLASEMQKTLRDLLILYAEAKNNPDVLREALLHWQDLLDMRGPSIPLSELRRILDSAPEWIRESPQWAWFDGFHAGRTVRPGLNGTNSYLQQALEEAPSWVKESRQGQWFDGYNYGRIYADTEES